MLFKFESSINPPPIKTWLVDWTLIVFTIPDTNPGDTPAPILLHAEPL